MEQETLIIAFETRRVCIARIYSEYQIKEEWESFIVSSS